MLSPQALKEMGQREEDRAKLPSFIRMLDDDLQNVLLAHLGNLHSLYAHPNRVLHYDQVLLTLLCGLFDTTDRSLRMLDDMSCGDEFHQTTGQRAARSTLSDAMKAMDARHLQPLILDLLKRVPALAVVDPDLAAFHRQLVAADGSIFSVPSDVLWGIALTRRNGKKGRQIRLNMQLDVLHYVPVDLSVSGQEEGNEAAAFIKRLKAEVVYIADRNFVNFDFVRAVLKANSDLVVRLKKCTNFHEVQSRPLTEQDVKAGVLSDRIGRLSDAFGDDRLFREVTVLDPETDKEVRFLTTLMEVSAAVIGKLYRHRWVIELFFKWLKCVAKVRHLVSHSRNGITMQLYAAMIMVLLTHLLTGHKPGKYEFNCLSWVASGKMTAAQMLEVLARRTRERAQNQARYTRKKAERAAAKAAEKKS